MKNRTPLQDAAMPFLFATGVVIISIFFTVVMIGAI